jgi:hypothetical protein
MCHTKVLYENYIQSMIVDTTRGLQTLATSGILTTFSPVSHDPIQVLSWNFGKYSSFIRET